MDDEFITESELGTKEYWDDFYQEELGNFNEYGDTGETWFGLKNSHKIIDWINENVDKKDALICDVGCGNGYILWHLFQKGFNHLNGLDYSEKAIEFCKTQYSPEQSSNGSKINFQVVDIIEDNFQTEPKFNVIVDKGTYDAICLMPNANIVVNREKYLKFLNDNLEQNGYFIIFTCNFTKDEMLQTFINNNQDLKLETIHEFESPVLSFGGKIGKQITGLVFRKVD